MELGVILLVALAVAWAFLVRRRPGEGVRTLEEFERERAARRRTEEARAREYGEDPDRL